MMVVGYKRDKYFLRCVHHILAVHLKSLYTHDRVQWICKIFLIGRRQGFDCCTTNNRFELVVRQNHVDFLMLFCTRDRALVRQVEARPSMKNKMECIDVCTFLESKGH